jgi:hypothetical protein
LSLESVVHVGVTLEVVPLDTTISETVMSALPVL